MNRYEIREYEEAAAQLQHRLERQERQRATRMRAATAIAASLIAGVVLLSLGATAVVRAAEPPKVSASSPAPRVSAPVKAATVPETLVAAANPPQAPVAEEAPAVSAPSAKQSPTPAAAASTPRQSKAKRATVASAPRRKAAVATTPAATQRLAVKIGAGGYEPSILTASSNAPIKLTVGKGEGCAAGFVMDSLGVNRDNSGGSVTINLGKLKPGTYVYHCAMDMVQGRLVVR